MNPGNPARQAPRPAPLERGRAAGVLVGLLAFTAGFAAAALFVVAGRGSTPPYLVSITVGLVGVGVIGYFYHRGTVALPDARIWSPAFLRALTEPVGVPFVPCAVLLYGLTALGLAGNVLFPLLAN